MTFDLELMRMLTSVMVMTFAFEDDKFTDQYCSSSWGSLEAVRVYPFTGLDYWTGIYLTDLNLTTIMGSKAPQCEEADLRTVVINILV